MASWRCGNMTDNGWRRDLERGKKIEREVLERMLAVFKETYQTFGKDNRFDIKIPELQFTIVVKFDPRSLETGNLVVEYYHNQPSGLSTSEASHWLFVTGNEEIWISKFQVLKCILAERIMPPRIHGPGDFHEKFVFLVTKDLLLRYADAVHKSDK